MKKIPFVVAMFLFPFAAFASPYVGKWKVAKQKTYDYAVAKIKADKKMKPRARKMALHFQGLIWKSDILLNFKKDKTFSYNVKVVWGKGKVFKRSTKGTWKKTKAGLSYTTIIKHRGKTFKELRTCVLEKAHLVCSFEKRNRKTVTFYKKMK